MDCVFSDRTAAFFGSMTAKRCKLNRGGKTACGCALGAKRSGHKKIGR